MTSQALNRPVDVLAVMRQACTALNGEGFHTAGDNLCVATRAVAELIEAAKDMRLCLQVLRDDHQAEPEDIAALERADDALAAIGSQP